MKSPFGYTDQHRENKQTNKQANLQITQVREQLQVISHTLALTHDYQV